MSKSAITRIIQAADDAAFPLSNGPTFNGMPLFPPWWISTSSHAYANGLCVICHEMPKTKDDEFYCDEHRKQRNEMAGK